MSDLFDKTYVIGPERAAMLNCGTLAFVGDAVYTMYIRGLVVHDRDVLSGKLHHMTAEYVKAEGQSAAVEKILDIMSPTEMDIYKRARNYTTHSVAKHADILDYKRATGFEAVLGYLYLAGDIDRLNFILSKCVERL